MFTPNWRADLLRAYSAWAFYALALITLAPDFIYLAFEIDTNPAVWSVLQLWVIVLGIAGRVVLQTKEGAFKRRLFQGAIIVITLLVAGHAMAQSTERATMQVLVPHVIQWEGEHRCQDDPEMHCAYLDIVGVPTVCFGETQGVELGDRFTDRECRRMLERRLSEDYRAGLHRYFTPDTKANRLTPHRDAAYVSLAYNVGIRAAGKSTATRRLNAGDIAGGCEAISWWNKAGGRRVRGLVNRRGVENGMCMRGLKGAA